MAWLDRTGRRAAVLPLRAVHAEEVPPAPASPAPEVFVVDGDLSVLASLVWLLDSFGIGALAFSSTAEFLRDAPASGGCVIVDVELHGVDRLVHFADELHRRGLSLPIVAMSADPFVSADEVQRAGAIAFLPKPFPGEALLDCLREAAAQSATLAS